MGPRELQQLKRATIWPAELLASALNSVRLNVRLSPGMAQKRDAWRVLEGGNFKAEVLGNSMVIHHINESCHFIYKKETFSPLDDPHYHDVAFS